MGYKKFPHLDSDNDFPYIENVDVYKFVNAFDYSRWNKNSKIRIVNVIWNSDYKDVVKFDSDSERDSWFDSLDEFHEFTLESKNSRLFPDGSIKLPIPYDVIAKYNYLYVEMPIATGEDNYIDYENSAGKRRWYFFIDSITYQAPNTTTVFLTPDVWTNFINDVDINYMILERGHAPVAYTDTDEYLSSPISHNEYLLAPDYDFGKNTISKKSEFIPFGQGVKWMCIASLCSYNDFVEQSFGAVSGNQTDSWDKPTYSNTTDRYGYQLVVNGFKFGDGRDYSNVSTPVSSSNSSDGNIPNGLNIYAIPASSCFGNGNFFEVVKNKFPGFFNTIVACFMVDEALIDVNYLGSLSNYNVYRCEGVSKHYGDLRLNKDMFGFPEKYSRFAKLYTYPYSVLELTDNADKTIEVKIEDTGEVGIELMTSVAFPYINTRLLFTGIAGQGATSYVWTNLEGELISKEMYNSDWYKYCFDMNIPTYSLYMDGRTAYNVKNYNRSLSNARRSALVGYHNSVRDANTARANAIDLATTAQNNVNASANTMVTNMGNSCNTATANTALTTATNSANRTLANNTATQITSDTNLTSLENTLSDITLMNQTVSTENESTIATTTNTVQGNITTGVSGGLMQGATAGLGIGTVGGPAGMAAGAVGGAIVGGVTGAITSGINASVAEANSVVITQANVDVLTVTRTRNIDVATRIRRNNTNVTELNNDCATAQTNNTNACLTSQTANTNDCNTTNTNNTSNTAKANATRTKNTSTNNAGYTRDVAILNAKEILENSQYTARAAYKDAGNSGAIPYGNYTGNCAPDAYGTRGVQIKVRTQSDGAIAQTGDMFARYGYALNQVWNVKQSGLNLMKHFTFWKAEDIWVDVREASTNLAESVIASIFRSGVTVWNNPDEIGRVSIYDN